jgi:DNA (cytosine-5)-methyltransferase 1
MTPLRTKNPLSPWIPAADLPNPTVCQPQVAQLTCGESKPTVLDFFAGSGLVSEALRPYFKSIWANDICEKKAKVFVANHPDTPLRPDSIEEVRGSQVPSAVLSWGSFPCQDLSLAGNMAGITSARSGLVWQWLRVMDEMETRPPIVVAENVVGLIAAGAGTHYRSLHMALVERGYRVGAVVLDSASWLPQSRKRVFVIGIQRHLDPMQPAVGGPTWCHPSNLIRVAESLPHWAWWALPPPDTQPVPLEQLVDWNAPCDGPERCSHNLDLVPERHRAMMEASVAAGLRVFPGYKRRRKGCQVLELRFDAIAGCLRTPEGGSSRQLLVLWRDGRFHTRLLTVRETARLMGAPDSYQLPGTYNDGYRAMGDAVALPVARYLAHHLLTPLAVAVQGATKCR